MSLTAVLFRGKLSGKEKDKGNRRGRHLRRQTQERWRRHKKRDDERSTTKTDEDKEYGDKDVEHEICVISSNINKIICTIRLLARRGSVSV